MQSADEIGNHAFPLLALMVVGVVFEDMTPLAKNLAILLVEGISALLKRRLVVNFKASGFLATLAAPTLWNREGDGESASFYCGIFPHDSCSLFRGCYGSRRGEIVL